MTSLITNDDRRPEFPDEIPKKSSIASHLKHFFFGPNSKEDEHSFSPEPFLISSIQFPEEMFLEVILRLPVKSLIRFRSVSKGMLQLIDSSSFIHKHNILRSVRSDRARSGSYWDDDDQEYAVLFHQTGPRRFYSLNFDNNNMNRAKAIELSCSFVKEEGIGLIDYCFLMDCCNGIVWFKKFQKGSYVFWNPSNGTFRKVDSCSCLPFSKESIGYDDVNDDYKIIGFINDQAASLQVYSLRNDSWRKIVFHRDFPSGQPCYSIRRAVCVGGVMHWMWTNDDDDERPIFIVAFNLATETFTSLPLPSEARQLRPCHFTEFRGRLCVTFAPPGYPSRNDGPHAMWVMEKYGVGSSWSRLYNYYIDNAVFPNIYFPNSRSRLLCYNREFNRQWCWWDPQQGTFERIVIPGVVVGTFPHTAHVYVRNLVRLDQSLV